MIEFSREEKAHMVPKIQDYLQRELDVEAGSFECEFFLDFCATEFGGFFYNRALKDANAVLQQRFDSMAESLDELEQPVDYQKQV